jgi:hypothetical protein
LKEKAMFKPFSELPKNGQPGSGLGNSPRLSSEESAVVLSLEHYERLRKGYEAARRIVSLEPEQAEPPLPYKPREIDWERYYREKFAKLREWSTAQTFDE